MNEFREESGALESTLIRSRVHKKIRYFYFCFRKSFRNISRLSETSPLSVFQCYNKIRLQTPTVFQPFTSSWCSSLLLLHPYLYNRPTNQVRGLRPDGFFFLSLDLLFLSSRYLSADIVFALSPGNNAKAVDTKFRMWSPRFAYYSLVRSPVCGSRYRGP